MSGAKHTPGSWVVDYENCGGGSTVVDARGYRLAHTSRVVAGGREVISEEEAKTNAHLIAAAPELLALCIEALDSLEGSVEGDIDYIDKHRVRARLKAVIEKARGES